MHPSAALIFATTPWLNGPGYRFSWKTQGRRKPNQTVLHLPEFISLCSGKKQLCHTAEGVKQEQGFRLLMPSPNCRLNSLSDNLQDSDSHWWAYPMLAEKKSVEASNNYLCILKKLFVKFLGLNIFKFFVFRDIVCKDFLNGLFTRACSDRVLTLNWKKMGLDWHPSCPSVWIKWHLPLQHSLSSTSSPACHRTNLKNSKLPPTL